LRRTTSFDVLSVKIRAGVLAVGDWKNQTRCHTIAKMTARCAQYVSALKIVSAKSANDCARISTLQLITIQWGSEIIFEVFHPMWSRNLVT